ncbi:MAG: ATP-binding protein [Patescibacteria group bacterium]
MIPEERRLVRLPTLPSWEKLLSRLYVLPETAVDQKALRLELLGLISNESVTVAQLYARLCVFLPKITGCEGVIIWGAGPLGAQIIATNLSSKKALRCVETKLIQRIAKPEHYHFNKSSPVALQVNQKTMTNCHLMSLGELDGQQNYLLTVSSRSISTETSRVFEVIRQVLGLRLKNNQLAQNLQQQATTITNLTSQLGEGMVMTNSSGQITLWNRSMQRLTGFRSSETVNRPFEQFFRRVGQLDWLTILSGEAKSPEPKHISADFQILTQNDELRWVSCLVTIYKNRSGVFEQAVLVARDISHKKNLEQKKNEFISIATHELRTPLTAVKGYLSLLERKGDNLTEKQLSYLSQATKASNRLGRLAEDLLRVTQIDQDRLSFKPQSIHLFPILKKVVRDFKPKALAKGVTLSLTTSKLPDTVRLDRERTEQIFANLIDNATKYTEQGSIKVSLENSEDRQGLNPQLIVNIRDSGIGISSKNIEEIFEKFHRAHRPEQSREQGAGLGLYIVKSFVEKQNGTITVKSRAGKGTHFAVAFPLEQTKRSKK